MLPRFRFFEGSRVSFFISEGFICGLEFIGVDDLHWETGSCGVRFFSKSQGVVSGGFVRPKLVKEMWDPNVVLRILFKAASFGFALNAVLRIVYKERCGPLD